MSPTTEESRRRIAVLGGGISGLTTAYVLARARQAGAPVEEFLIETKDRLGGVIQTENVDGFVIEAGPDSFLTEKPEAAALCRELGIGDSLIGSNDSDRRTSILHRGKLTPLPDGMMLLVPTRLWPMVNTPLLPWRSKVALASEWMMPPSISTADESVADFVRRHFGSAVLENIADPLLAGVYGGDSALLLGKNATENAFKKEPLSDFRVIHLAVHAVTDAQYPDRAALVLGPGGAESDDGLLQVREIATLTLNAELVTLSACATGIGKPEGEVGVVSLQQAFLMAGAKAVVASLWEVEDHSTTALMEAFYQHLAQKEDKAAALAHAKRDLLDRYPGIAPYYWASFVMAGESSGQISFVH